MRRIESQEKFCVIPKTSRGKSADSLPEALQEIIKLVDTNFAGTTFGENYPDTAKRMSEIIKNPKKYNDKITPLETAVGIKYFGLADDNPIELNSKTSLEIFEKRNNVTSALERFIEKIEKYDSTLTSAMFQHAAECHKKKLNS